MPDRDDVRKLLAGCAEAEAGVDPAEWSALEVLLGYVEDDRLVIPEDEGERDELARCFVTLGWGANPAPVGETEEGDL